MTEFPVDALFEALANSVWRGMLLVVVVAVALRFLKGSTAAERYSVWLAVLLVIGLSPVVETGFAWVDANESPTLVIDLAEMPSVLSDQTGPQIPTTTSWKIPELRVIAWPLMFLWLVMVAVLSLRLALGCWKAIGLKSGSLDPSGELSSQVANWRQRLNPTRASSTRVSDEVNSAAAIGWVNPVVLLPIDCERRLSWDDIELVWRHEQAHLVRRDDWTQLVTECLCAVMWFHPATYWIRRELDREREVACDEAVVQGGVAPGLYAGALGRWAEHVALKREPVGVMGIGRSESQIIRRIEMLLAPSRIFRNSETRWTFVAGLATAASLAGWLALAGPVVVRAQSAEEPTVVVEVPVDVAVPAVVPPVSPVAIEPVLVGQVPPVPVAPAAPPAAPRPPAPVRVDAEHEQAREVHERVQRIHQQMRPHLEAIQEEAAKIHTYVEEHIAPHRQKIHELASAFAEAHAEEIAPFVEEMARLAGEMRQATSEEIRDAKQLRMAELAAEMEAREPALRQRLDQAMERLEVQMEPFQERLREMELALQEKEKALEGAQRQMEEALEDAQ